jgi:hypothetical protein
MQMGQVLELFFIIMVLIDFFLGSIGNGIQCKLLPNAITSVDMIIKFCLLIMHYSCGIKAKNIN